VAFTHALTYIDKFQSEIDGSRELGLRKAQMLMFLASNRPHRLAAAEFVRGHVRGEHGHPAASRLELV
jgi:hypothetical protein